MRMPLAAAATHIFSHSSTKWAFEKLLGDRSTPGRGNLKFGGDGRNRVGQFQHKRSFCGAWAALRPRAEACELQVQARPTEKTRSLPAPASTGGGGSTAQLPSVVLFRGFGGGEWNRTTDLRVMSPSL